MKNSEPPHCWANDHNNVHVNPEGVVYDPLDPHTMHDRITQLETDNRVLMAAYDVLVGMTAPSPSMWHSLVKLMKGALTSTKQPDKP